MSKKGDQLVYQTAERVARENYGKLVAFLSKRTRDVSASEDALSEAFAAALRDWPANSIPENPQAWILAVAKRKVIDAARITKVHANSVKHLLLLHEEIEAIPVSDFSDDRLGLMFACAHPLIDVNIRSPLILQTILGLTASDIGSAFLVSPEAMGQRLARAKNKIKVAGIPFRIPNLSELGDRLDTVLEAVYAAYANAWSDVVNAQSNLAEEAIWLGRLIVQMLPDEPEALGLLSLMLFLQSRKNARRDWDGKFVPLTEQKVEAWDDGKLAEAEELLRKASSKRTLGRYQLEAAIQSAHTTRRFTGMTDWKSILELYNVLSIVSPSPVVSINRALALAEVEGVHVGLSQMPRLEDFPELADYQPFHAARAALLNLAGRNSEAHVAYNLAIGLESDLAIRAFLISKQKELDSVFRTA